MKVKEWEEGREEEKDAERKKRMQMQDRIYELQKGGERQTSVQTKSIGRKEEEEGEARHLNHFLLSF